MPVKKTRISQKDIDQITKHIKDQLVERKQNKFRTAHERIWSVLDDQIAMNPPAVVKNNEIEDWESAIQLGDLADASEIISADVMRITFANDTWFQPHVELESEITEEGQKEVPDVQLQRSSDNVLRSFMMQQHKDFGLKDRVKLSIKEALHHGGFVAEARWEKMPKFHDGSKVEKLESPTWVPHSMWNCYPDSSPSVIGTDLFYRGSMIIVSYLPRHVVMKMPWKNLNKIPKKTNKNKEVKTEDVEIITYYGDISIDRKDRKVFFPNRKFVLANEVFVHTEINKTAYSPIIYSGYEKDDVRDPYYTSPIIKRSPMHRLATHMANKFIDAVDLKTKPPIVYDALDSQFAANDGPPLYPGAKMKSRGGANFKLVETADPSWALSGLQMAKQHVAEGTGTDAIRKGVSAGTEQTATEVVKTDQKSEIRTVDFVGVLERQAIRPFLYMQFELNKLNLTTYPFYNTDMNTPDFMRISKTNLPDAVHFEITGSRNLLGEEQRTARFNAAAAAVLSNEVLTKKTDVDEVLRQVWMDTGVKDPERFLIVNKDENPEADQIRQEAEQAIQQMQQQLQQAAQELEKFSLINEKHNAEKEQLQTDINSLQEQMKLIKAVGQAQREFISIKQDSLQSREEIQSKIEDSQSRVDELLQQASVVEGRNAEQVETLASIAGQNSQDVSNIADFLQRQEQEKERRNQIIFDALAERGATDIVNKLR